MIRSMSRFPEAERKMWELAQQHTARTGYQRGAKRTSLAAEPPVIDCSGWVAFLLTEAMAEANSAAGTDVFDWSTFAVPQPWSDRMILDIENRTAAPIEGADILGKDLPRCATIGLNEGYFPWQGNKPRVRGINHIAQIVRNPADDTPFISDSYSIEPGGVRLLPLNEWLDRYAGCIRKGNAWAVDPFAMAKQVDR